MEKIVPWGTMKKQIAAWLQLPDEQKHNACPFGNCQCHLRGFCESWFPRIRNQLFEDSRECPCKRYTLPHVIRVARKMLEAEEG